MWILVFVWLEGVNAYSVAVDLPFVDMIECFEAREMLSVKVGGEDGYFPKGTNALCIPMPDEDV